MDAHPLSLYELNALVKRSITSCMPDTYWLQAELSDVRSNYSGHCYLEFVQKEPRGNNLIAKARGTIWNNVYRLLKPYFEEETGQAFVAGIKVLVEVSVEFHELYGYSLTVADIDPAYTLNKELELPLLTQRIAVISSATAAGYGDFCNQLEHNPYGFVFYPRLFPAVMQGDRVEETIIAALDTINARRDDWDVVVIIRGGGATSDLSGFDTYDLAANCAQFPLPVITGIGHERDDTVLDSVSHTRVKTPTAAAEFLINHLRSTAETLEDYASSILYAVTTRMEREKTRLTRLVERIPMQTRMRLREERYRQERVIRQMEVNLQSRLMRESHRLELVEKQLGSLLQKKLTEENHRLRFLEQQIKAASPEHLLKRGYSITLKEGKAVTDASCLKEGDKLVTRFAKGEVESIVITDK